MAPAGRPRSFDKSLALRNAMYVFWAKGYEGTTMSDLVEAIGVKGPSVYAAFGNKDSIFVEAVKAYSEMILNGPLSSLTEEPDIYISIKKLLESNLSFFMNSANPRGCLIMTSAINATPEHSELVDLVRSYREEYKELLIKRFQLAIDQKQIREEFNSLDLAEYYLMVIHGMALRAKDGSNFKQLSKAVEMSLSGLRECLKVPHS
ncbi:TetR/AcrR family transcriptional regulator [Methylophilus sp. DW102]|uniref:TetR/AcrR family transcriptional regulator n=1 Tax=Methylophilus sp. DW102 TaxID=3095607 RepID=UPI0030CCBE47